MMFMPLLGLTLLLVHHPHGGNSATANEIVRAPVGLPMGRLPADEAAILIEKLEKAQRALKSGKFQHFRLLSGSVASFEKTKVSPRDAFFEVSFKQVQNVERLRAENPLWQPYKMDYAPQGLGALYWEIEVVIGANDDIAQVQMIYRGPTPF